MKFAALLAMAALPLSGQILNLKSSPYAKLQNVPVQAVKMGEGFWAPRMKVNVDKSIPTMLDELESHGRIDNFRRLTGQSKAKRQGPVYTDSDVYKWIEGAAFALQDADDPALRARIEKLTDLIVAVQEPSGYLNTYYVEENAPKRFTEMTRSHELYNLGHLLQGAIAYYRATGQRRLLDAGIRYCDFLVKDFGPDRRPALTGHPELEMAMIELYRTTGNKAYLNFAGYLLSGVEKDRLHLTNEQLVYLFSGKPFTDRTEVEGHAVRAMYAMSGATDYFLETGDQKYWQTLDRLWNDLVSSKMYITGGVGSRAAGEAFGEKYELPNAQAYGESCAAIANMMWNWRMLMATGDAKYTDVMERALYNGINSGMSLDGTLYCYRNPLESTGEKIRNPWYDTTCCPPNLERVLASLPGYLYATSKDGVYVNLFHASTMKWHLADGAGLTLAQTTGYPWKGDVRISVDPETAKQFTVFVRIPAWARDAHLTVNGKPAGSSAAGRYAAIYRTWKAGDQIELNLDMQPRLTTANPLVRENAGRVAVERGPIVYCLEQADQTAVPSLFDASLTKTGERFTEQFRSDLLGGVLVLRHAGAITPKPQADQPLYRDLRDARAEGARPAELAYIPYYAWANRGEMPMEVWVPYSR